MSPVRQATPSPGILKPHNGVLKRASPASKAAMPSAHGDDAVTWVRQRQRLQQQRAKRTPRRRNRSTKPKPVPVFLLPPKQPPPPPQPPTAKTPAFLRLAAGAGHTPLGAEAAPEMDRRPASVMTPTEGVMERWERPLSGTQLRGGRARGGGGGSQDGSAGAGGSGAAAGTPALLPARNCAPTPPPLPPLGTAVTTRSRSSRSSSGSPVDNLVMQPFRRASPASAAGSAIRSGNSPAKVGRPGRSRFSVGGASDAAVARESATLSGGGGGSNEAETFSFGVGPAGGSGSPKSGGSLSHGDVARADSAAAESLEEPVLRTRWDTVSKATAPKSSLRTGAASRRSSVSGSVQQLRFSAGEQPALQSEHEQQQSAAQPSADPGGAGGDRPVGTSAPQPLSPAEPLAGSEAEQPDIPVAAAAYSSDDDGGGYDGGDWGGDSDVDAPPGDGDADHAVASAAADSPAAQPSSQLPLVTPRPRPSRRRAGAKHQHERRKNLRKSLAGMGLRTQGGVRRSSRNHHRPLEYWRNEKKVYTTRDHTSLPTMDHYEERTPSPAWPAPGNWAAQQPAVHRKKKARRPNTKKVSRLSKASK